MGLFEQIPIRSNGQNVDSSWWNTLRSKLIEAFPNLVTNIGTPSTIANNQSTLADITGFSFDKTEGTSWRVFYEIYRKTSSSERLEQGFLIVLYKPIADTFTIYRRVEDGDDVLNNGDDSIQITSTGQVRYKSDNMSGTSYVGKFSYKTLTSFKGN